MEPSEECNEVCERVITALYGIRDQRGRCPIAFALKRDEAQMIGLYGDQVGDMVYGMAAGYTALLEPTEGLEELAVPRGAISVADDRGL